LAGGLNLYGYANGDPINGSDPFGLKVVFTGAEAQALWRQLMADARNARRSDDEGTRKAGALLFNTMRSMERHEHTFEISYTPFGGARRRETGGGESVCLPVLLTCTVDVDSGAEPLAGRFTTLAHEAGGAWASKQRVGGHDDLLTGGIMYENAARRIYGCGGFRSTHTVAQGPPPTYCR
jgi:hypothetical protein